MDDTTNPGAIPQRYNTGAYSVPYPAAGPPPYQPVPSYKDGPSYMQTWQVMLGALSGAAILGGFGWFMASRIFVTQENYAQQYVEQVKLNGSLKAAIDQSNATTGRLEVTLDRLSEKIEALDLPKTRPRR